MNRLPFMVTPRKLLYRKERILSTNKSVLAHYNCSGSPRGASRHNHIQPIGVTTKQGRPKATTTAKMMPCISRHHGNFSHHVTTSPQHTASAKSYGLAITSWFSTNRSGSPRGASRHNTIQPIGVATKQGRPKATTTTKMMPCVSRHYGNFSHHETASPQHTTSAKSYGLAITSWFSTNRSGSPRGASRHNHIQSIGATIKQGRPKATTTLDNGIPSNAITLFLLHENHLTIEFVKCHHSCKP